MDTLGQPQDAGTSRWRLAQPGHDVAEPHHFPSFATACVTLERGGDTMRRQSGGAISRGTRDRAAPICARGIASTRLRLPHFPSGATACDTLGLAVFAREPRWHSAACNGTTGCVQAIRAVLGCVSMRITEELLQRRPLVSVIRVKRYRAILEPGLDLLQCVRPKSLLADP